MIQYSFVNKNKKKQEAPSETGYFWEKLYEKYPDIIQKYPMKNIWIIP